MRTALQHLMPSIFQVLIVSLIVSFDVHARHKSPEIFPELFLAGFRKEGFRKEQGQSA